LLGLLAVACTGDAEDTSAGQDSGGEPPVGDTAPETTSDCSELSWRTEADLLLTHQDQVDEFCPQWNAVDGNLTIDLDGDPDAPIWELDGISCLCEVTGDLEIFWIADFDPDAASPPPPHSSTDLELGLLERVGGSLSIHDIWGLAQLSFMDALVEVGGDLEVYGLDNLLGVDLIGLRAIGGTLSLSDVALLQAVEMGGLEQLGGLRFTSENESDLAALRKVSFPLLERIERDFELDGPRGLYLVEADALQSIDGSFALRGACSLELDLPLLSQAGSLELVGNCGLESLTGLPIAEISGQAADGVSVRIEGNDGLSQEVLDAFLTSMVVTGAGTVQATAAEDGACSAWQASRWEVESEWCSD
jgi:hypothetical protein